MGPTTAVTATAATATTRPDSRRARGASEERRGPVRAYFFFACASRWAASARSLIAASRWSHAAAARAIS